MPSYILPIYSFILIYLYKYIFQGLNYLLIPIRPAEGSGLTVAYDIMNAVFSSFQVITTILTLFCIVYVSTFCITCIPLWHKIFSFPGSCCVVAFVLHKLRGSVAFANPSDPVHGQQQHQLHPPHPRQQQEWPHPWVGLGHLDEQWTSTMWIPHPNYYGRSQPHNNWTRK